MKVIEKKYQIVCDRCKTEFICKKSELEYDNRYHCYELYCPCCRNFLSTNNRTLHFNEIEIQKPKKIEPLEKIIYEENGIQIERQPNLQEIKNKLNEVINYINKGE